MRKEKQFLLDEVKDNLECNSAFVLTSYVGINPNLTEEFRHSVFQTGGSFKVVKKRVFFKAAQELGINIEEKILKGHIGVIYPGEDVVATTKAIYNFTKDNEGLMEVVGGLFEGKLCSPNEFKEISKLPGKDQMRAEFIGLLEAPMTQTVGTFESVLSGLISCIDQKHQKNES